jgi:hypothetical protein
MGSPPRHARAASGGAERRHVRPRRGASSVTNQRERSDGPARKPTVITLARYTSWPQILEHLERGVWRCRIFGATVTSVERRMCRVEPKLGICST